MGFRKPFFLLVLSLTSGYACRPAPSLPPPSGVEDSASDKKADTNLPSDGTYLDCRGDIDSEDELRAFCYVIEDGEPISLPRFNMEWEAQAAASEDIEVIVERDEVELDGEDIEGVFLSAPELDDDIEALSRIRVFLSIKRVKSALKQFEAIWVPLRNTPSFASSVGKEPDVDVESILIYVSDEEEASRDPARGVAKDLPSANIYTPMNGCYLFCAVSDADDYFFKVNDDYVLGQIRVEGSYDEDSVCRPKGYENEDITGDDDFAEQCAVGISTCETLPCKAIAETGEVVLE